MRKLAMVLSVMAAAFFVSQPGWAFVFKQACSGRGYIVTANGNLPLAFDSVQAAHWTGPSAQQFDSLSETLVTNGLACGYKLDTTQTSTATVNEDGGGNSTVYLVGLPTNAAACAPSLVTHSSFVATSTGSRLVSLDPGVVVDGDCQAKL